MSPVPSVATLAAWRKKYPQDYLRIQQDVIPQIHEVLAAESAAHALDWSATQTIAREQLTEALIAREIPAKDLANVAKSVTISTAVMIDKYNQTRSTEAVRAATQNLSDMVGALAAEFPGLIAVEPTDAEVVPDE